MGYENLSKKASKDILFVYFFQHKNCFSLIESSIGVIGIKNKYYAIRYMTPGHLGHLKNEIHFGN